MCLQRQQNPYHPFHNFGQYQLAKALAMPEKSTASHIEQVAVNGVSFLREDVAFVSVAHFHNCLDEISGQMAPWQSNIIMDQTVQLKANARYWYRDSLAVLQEILDNPKIAKKCVWSPVKQFNHDNQRVYTDMHTSDWWWEVQVAPYRAY